MIIRRLSRGGDNRGVKDTLCWSEPSLCDVAPQCLRELEWASGPLDKARSEISPGIIQGEANQNRVRDQVGDMAIAEVRHS